MKIIIRILLLLTLTLVMQISTFAQAIYGSNIAYNIVGGGEHTVFYEIKISLYVPCGSINNFRFRSTDEHRLAIYKGNTKENAVLLEEHPIGGSTIPIFVLSEVPPNACASSQANSPCMEIIQAVYRVMLLRTTENYYFLFESATRNIAANNIITEENDKLSIGIVAPKIVLDRVIPPDNTSFQTSVFTFSNWNWKNMQLCTNDTARINVSAVARAGLRYEYKLQTPSNNWMKDTPLTYKPAYSPTNLGQHYLNLSSEGELKVHIATPGEYLVKLCITSFDTLDGAKMDELCREITLQVYDCEPKVVATLAQAKQSSENEYLVSDCDTNVSLFGRNAGSLSNGSFQWIFQDNNGEEIRNFNQTTSIQFPQAGTYQGQLLVEAEGCTDSVQVQVVIGDAPTSGLQERYEVCDLPITLEGNPDVDFIWEDGSTKPEREILASGNYTLTVIGNCERRQTIEIINLAENLASENLIRAEDTTICLQQPYTLSLQQPKLTNIRWNGEASLAIAVTQSGYYSVEATTAEGCELYDGIQIEVLDCAAKLYIPSAFSPNNDGVNDLFEIGTVQADIQSIQIFNRWGALVYEGTTDWDGRIKGVDAAEGMYVYKVEYVESLLQIPSSKTGELILMR